MRNLVVALLIAGPCTGFLHTVPQPQALSQHHLAAVSVVPCAVESSAAAETGEVEYFNLSQLQAGEQLSGRVVDVKDGFAFVDCNVKRVAQHGNLKQVNAFLHWSDVKEPFHIGSSNGGEGTQGTTSIHKGMTLDVFVKDVFKNQGRFTVSLDSRIDSSTVVKQRVIRRQHTSSVARRRRGYTGQDLVEGEVLETPVSQINDKGVLVEVGAPRLSLVHIKDIRNSLGGAYIANLHELLSPGDLIRVCSEGRGVAEWPLLHQLHHLTPHQTFNSHSPGLGFFHCLSSLLLSQFIPYDLKVKVMKVYADRVQLGFVSLP
ncbi:unnamed protein product, partial [Chrysoparadoxa australica]